jgi:phosphate transport system permease protein
MSRQGQHTARRAAQWLSWATAVVLDRTEPAVEWLIRACGWSAVLFVFGILFFVFREAAPMLFGGLDLKEFFTSAEWRPTSQVRPQYGILALLAGTLSVTALAMVVAVPMGLGAAIYIAEFARGKVRETLKVLIELLAAVPSVVWGFVGLMLLGPLLIRFTGAPAGVNLLNGGIILGLMSVPIMVSMAEDALKSVPDSYREAALSLGASRWEVVYRVLFPAAKNGLLAAVLLGVGRAIGETMAVLLATGNSIKIPHSLLDPVRTLTATIATELGEAVDGDVHYRVLFVIGIVLFAVTFAVNVTADLVVKGIRSEKSDCGLHAGVLPPVLGERRRRERVRAVRDFRGRAASDCRTSRRRRRRRSAGPAGDRRGVRPAGDRAPAQAEAVAPLLRQRACRRRRRRRDGRGAVAGHPRGRRRVGEAAPGRRHPP